MLLVVGWETPSSSMFCMASEAIELYLEHHDRTLAQLLEEVGRLPEDQIWALGHSLQDVIEDYEARRLPIFALDEHHVQVASSGAFKFLDERLFRNLERQPAPYHQLYSLMRKVTADFSYSQELVKAMLRLEALAGQEGSPSGMAPARTKKFAFLNNR